MERWRTGCRAGLKRSASAWRWVHNDPGVLWLVTKECALLVAVGLGIGIPLALASTRVIASQLFELSPMDPLTIALVSGALTIVAAVAGFVPARRAIRVDPMVALRYE
jgi:ABC-type antimicrobial peptide transport system permease subunit